MGRRVYSFLPAAIFALAPALCAAVAQSQPVKTDLVTLNVTALDDHDRPIDGLTSKDFQVSDAGKRQQIVHLAA